MVGTYDLIPLIGFCDNTCFFEQLSVVVSEWESQVVNCCLGRRANFDGRISSPRTAVGSAFLLLIHQK